MALDAKSKLRRFSYLGNFKPIYRHLRGSINVKVFLPQIEGLCKTVNNEEFLELMKDLLHNCNLVRRDETLFIYAVYLYADIEPKWRDAVRKEFPALIRDDSDLFLFCKYAQIVHCAKLKKPRGFNRTVRRAISSWYQYQKPAAITTAWLTHRGANGFSHADLIKLSHVSDNGVGAEANLNPFFSTCTNLLKRAETGEGLVSAKRLQSTTSEAVDASGDHQKPNEAEESVDQTEKSHSDSEISPSVLVSMSKLRITRNPTEALKIIRKFKLKYKQVPHHLLKDPGILEELLPTMTYMQLLKWMRNTNCLHKNGKLMKVCKSLLANKDLLQKGNIHPIRILCETQIIAKNSTEENSLQRPESSMLPHIGKLYEMSFGLNEPANLKMHITLNLEERVRNKYLLNLKNVTYVEAAAGLAFGYFKCENQVDVFYWPKEKFKLEQIPWTKKMTAAQATIVCNQMEVKKSVQRLVTPVMKALTQEMVYDVFLAIVPSAGRGNPRNSSEFLAKFLNKYRETKNPRAKYVIVCMRKFKKCLNFSDTVNENILEICGLDHHVPGLINDFVLNRFV